MALSLADELAAFDDAQGGNGISLAEEFGLDMDAKGPGGEFFCSLLNANIVFIEEVETVYW
jgi:hypothetical protein